ncbi:isoprenoid biosynthesis glyoxalase ElbB [Bdellovibrio bacteriovorus]|uniref:Enhancing lycopene biosynthesis protein 2 n=1 Tax=Bdellovibrio bacteriovorus (strain ATCC 15356 / DSM 50701 / NCIMB 9529 / HD100) TaxID=264462 RepID=Q6MQ93_BDEBA|nr:isoprenoid biosynthesis glyoxalase ElbB [Bdellovibrio bacteriovorus]AHZ86668.1 isoprenoid biosynthesis protein [Bdellovibrio bacteriovorus]BEV67109.1 Glyoxalase ElbB [Bdellovibrio bacteriovorus]CAE78554.1 Enhancing lycopene biosynthesis protein 2 [Bdellovibrio bacteriovorus HD100]
MKKIAVVLSGCGHRDGSEITESVSLLIGLHQAGAEVHCFAPDIQIPITNHINGEAQGEKRSLLTEAARIARGHIQSLDKLHAKDFDAVVFPGGYGAAKNLSNWAEKGAQCEVNPDVKRVILEFHSASKPIGALCIAPVLVAKVLGDKKVTVTIGDDAATAAEIEKTGAIHEECPVNDYITDRESKVVTTPAYMYGDAKPNEVFAGIFGLAHEIVEWA